MLSEIKEKVNAVIIKQFTRDGAMMQYNSIGETKGRYPRQPHRNCRCKHEDGRLKRLGSQSYGHD
jgi:hypothetical protein